MGTIVWLVTLLALIMLITTPLIILKRKGCTAEINVIWYAFSLVLVVWWCINLALHLRIIELPAVPVDTILPGADEPPPLSPWTGRYFYLEVKRYLTDISAELALVASILILTIVPQFLNYILAGLSGCAATPKLVWQFEKIATWSLIRFLAAFGGISVAEALGIYEINTSDWSIFLESLSGYKSDLIWGLSAVGLAFIVAVFQVYTLEAADALGKAWQHKPHSWPHRVHRFFTRNLPREECKLGIDAEQATFDAREIWGKLTPAQQQEVGSLVVRALFERSRSSASSGGSQSDTVTGSPVLG